jgi:hypothetical protein
MSTESLRELIRRTAIRRQIAEFASRCRWGILAAATLFLVLLLTARLLALLPSWFTPGWLWCIPAIALCVAALFLRRCSPRDLGRLIDKRTGSKELFLTATMIELSEGEFQPIVLTQAEERAAQISPAQIVPFHWQRGARDVLIACAVLTAAVLWLPQLDPFGRDQQRRKIAQQELRMRETKNATLLRAEQLAQKEAAESEQIQHGLAELEKTFKEAKPDLRETNLKRLAEHQKELGEMWRKVSSELPRDSFDKAAQRLGAADAKKAQQIREELKRGDLATTKKEISELRATMQKLAALPDSAEKRAQQEELAQRLGSLAQTLSQELNSPKLNAALSRALQQLDMAKLAQLGQQGMDAARDSLNLAEQELQTLVEMLENARALEEALKNLQMARQLASQCLLDGEACKNCNGMGDYAALYAKLLGSRNRIGPGMGPNPGLGAGGKAPEDDTLKSAFKSEKTNTALTGGKMLLQWKTKEVGETGARVDEYRDVVRQVKQGVSEAIASEQVPPGYHATIQKYFDALPEK